MKKIFIYKLLDFLVLTLIFTLTQNSANAKENYFNEAKNEGDTLIVTLTSDDFCRKGPNRPIFSENLRGIKYLYM